MLQASTLPSAGANRAPNPLAGQSLADSPAPRRSSPTSPPRKAAALLGAERVPLLYVNELALLHRQLCRVRRVVVSFHLHRSRRWRAGRRRLLRRRLLGLRHEAVPQRSRFSRVSPWHVGNQPCRRSDSTCPKAQPWAATWRTSTSSPTLRLSWFESSVDSKGPTRLGSRPPPHGRRPPAACRRSCSSDHPSPHAGAMARRGVDFH